MQALHPKGDNSQCLLVPFNLCIYYNVGQQTRGAIWGLIKYVGVGLNLYASVVPSRWESWTLYVAMTMEAQGW